MKKQNEIGQLYLNYTRTGLEFLAGEITVFGEKIRINLEENRFWKPNAHRPYFRIYQEYSPNKKS